MSSADQPRPADSRARAARTKRDRTRAALLEAADTAFGLHGWSRTRVEDIAAAATVSAATAYNHFPTKHALIGHVFRPLVSALCAQAECDLATGRPIDQALVDQVRALVRTTSRHRTLAGAFLAACQEYAARVHAAPRVGDELDPRALAPVSDGIRLLVARGQGTGELRRFPAAEDISSMITSLLLMRVVEAPDEPPETTVELLLSVLFGTLHPERLVDPLSPTLEAPPGGPPGPRTGEGRSRPA
ncbi:MAG: TetR/AcrR family transcriptional regulator [Pseudonocardia sp.]